MSQPSLFAAPKPPDFEGIDIRCCGVEAMLAEVRGARLILADPPWQYSVGAEGKGVAQPELNGIYNCLTDADIAHHLDLAFDAAGPACRLACWFTWPKLAEWIAAGLAGPRWGSMTTGGAWTKQAPTSGGAGRMVQPGVGYHWRGQSEPVAVFTRGSTGRPSELILNAWVSPPTNHSEKPVEWLRSWVRAWTSPGDLVVDLYAGMAPVARACRAEGRRYVGAEIDPARCQQARERLALYAPENARRLVGAEVGVWP